MTPVNKLFAAALLLAFSGTSQAICNGAPAVRNFPVQSYANAPGIAGQTFSVNDPVATRQAAATAMILQYRSTHGSWSVPPGEVEVIGYSDDSSECMVVLDAYSTYQAAPLDGTQMLYTGVPTGGGPVGGDHHQQGPVYADPPFIRYECYDYFSNGAYTGTECSILPF